MIGSVQQQTYGNWELCLADGSDDAHSYVGEICRELAAKDGRICYRKLEKNEGIAGNTNQCLKMCIRDRLLKLAEPLMKTDYGKYMVEVANGL